MTSFRNLEQVLNTYPPIFDPSVRPAVVNDEAQTSSLALPIPEETRGSASSGYWTSVDYRQRYLAGELTPTVVIETLLPMIQKDGRSQGKLSIGFVEVKPDLIRLAAAASTKRYRLGKSLGPLDGVPIAVKDEVHLKGYRRNLGSKLDFSHALDATSWCVEKWEEAGAIIIGKTTMHEIGIGEDFFFPSPFVPAVRRR